LVQAVEAGDTNVKQALGQRLLDGISDDKWDAWRFIEAGLFLPLAFLDPANIEQNDLEWLCEDEEVSLARANEILENGLSGVELTRWRERVVDRAFAPGEFDREMRWFIIEVRRTGGCVAYIASFGYVDDGADWYDLPSTSFVAAYRTYTEVMNALKSVGFTGPKDFEARSGDMHAGK
jgi:hypothetical protein